MPAAERLFGAGKDRAFGRGLAEAARAAVKDALAVKKGERMLIVTEPDAEVAPIAMAVHDAAVATGADVVFMAQSPRGAMDLTDAAVIRALETDPDVVAVLTQGGLGADPERILRPIHGTYSHYFQYLIGEGRARGFWSPGVSKRLFARAVPVDRAAMAEEGEALGRLLEETVELRITSDTGTDLVIPLQGQPTVETGDYRTAGRGGNLPAGEAVAPASPGLASGRLVIDGTLGLPTGAQPLRSPLVLEVESGRVVSSSGGAANAFEKALASAPGLAERAVSGGWLTRDQAEVYAENARRIAEVGLGLNPLAKLTGNVLVDEKVRGTAHIGLGAASHEMPPGAPVSIDGVLRRPTVTAVLEDGAEVVLLARGDLVGAARLAAK